MTLVLWVALKRCPHRCDSVMRRPSTPMSLCVFFLMCVSLTPVMARRAPKSRLSLWIDEQQVKTLIGLGMEISLITNGEVVPYVNSPEVYESIVIPPEIDTVNLTWQAGGESYTYVFDNFTSLDQHLLYQPLLGIPERGYIPRYPTVFQITIPCKGKEKGVASLRVGLKIFDHWQKPLKGTPIRIRLKKQCVAFVTSSLCRPGCRNGGTCNGHGVCECPQGFKGPLCDIALCGRLCQYGHCVPEGYCWCDQGYYGDACEFSLCDPKCKNGGTCVGPNHCQCTAPFGGPLCEMKDDTERPRRSNEPIITKKRKVAKQVNKGVEEKLRKAEKRLLKIIFRRSQKWDLTSEEQQMLTKMNSKTDSLLLQERRYLVNFLTRHRRHLDSKDKTKVKRFKNLIRKSKNGQKKSSRRRKE
ncbi:wnt inhibitory factor 1-like isoform X2 [Physella acuta]|uniref:wnt inhibitory factor 1-like isoform X2 n=1 Tax=Physella acuta TaxID=109671 RepID=UPI0027DE591F|nr:wnt inhibitory factor 1-like isoform X2 [Physella acuta]